MPIQAGVPPAPIHVASLPLSGKRLTPTEWARIEQLCDQWKAEVLAAARRHPARSFRLGVEQVEAFTKLLSGVPGAVPRAMFGGQGPSMREAERWMRTYTLRELDDSLNTYIGRIKDALLYGLRHQVNPTQVASWLYHATKDSRVNWQLIARTEMVRANAMGRLRACQEMGFDQVWVPPHVGACKSCKRLLENQVFQVSDLLEASNYGRPESEWVPTVPLHPRCRHGYLPYVPEVYEASQEHYAQLAAAGLTDEDRLDELFDSSGQLRDGVTLSDTEQQAMTWKTGADYGVAIAKTMLSPTFAFAKAELDVAKMPTSLDGVLLDPDAPEGPPLGPPLDLLLFQGLRLRDDVALALEAWWAHAAGETWRDWSWLFMPAHSRVPVVLVDYDRLRHARKDLAKFSDEDLHFTLVSLVAAARGGAELAPGLPLDLRILPLDAGHAPDGALLRLLDAFQPGPAWYVDGVTGTPAMWVNGEPEGEAPELAKTLPDYTWADPENDPENDRENDRVLPLAHRELDDVDRLLSEDEFLAKHQTDVGKMSPAAPNTGVEHWITVHPHGDLEKGQPVLVRNNTDGTMTVIGGAGGSMNYMRLDPKRRIDQAQSKANDKQADAKQAAGLGGPEQTITEEERERQEQEFRANQARARKDMEKADEKISGLQAMLQDLVENGIGAKWLTHGLIRHADGSTEEYELGFMERKQAMRKLIAGALQTLAVGRIDNRDAEDAPYLFTERRGDFENMPDAEGAGSDSATTDESDPAAAADEKAAREENAQPDPEAEARKINRRLPPLDEDQANAVMKLERQIARWRRVKSKARAITQPGKASSSAYALEWSDARRRRRRAQAGRSPRSARSPRASCCTSDRTPTRSPTSARSTRAR
jgi:hypothetical protein